MPIPGYLQSPTVQPLGDVDKLIHEILTAVEVKHRTEVGPNLPSQLPLCVAYRYGGGAVHPMFLDQALVLAQCWAATKADAWTLAATVRLAFWQAYSKQRVYPTGIVNSYAELTGPAENRQQDQPENTWCYVATYEFRIRPIH